jgi:hypothetical protein
LYFRESCFALAQDRFYGLDRVGMVWPYDRSHAVFSRRSELRLAKRWNKSSFPVNEQETASVLYKKLLRLYPREFRERLGESMEQTFHDLGNERKRQSAHGWFRFILWTFIETAMGILREHVLLIEGVMMKTMLASPILAVVISFILCVLPFMILEWTTRSDLPRSNASPMLWVVLWLLSAVCFAILMLLVRNVRAGKSIMTSPVSLLLGVVFLVLLAWNWGALIMDQMPCFLGGSGC